MTLSKLGRRAGGSSSVVDFMKKHVHFSSLVIGGARYSADPPVYCQ